MKKFGHGYDCAVNGLEAFERSRARTVNYRCIFMGSSKSYSVICELLRAVYESRAPIFA